MVPDFWVRELLIRLNRALNLLAGSFITKALATSSHQFRIQLSSRNPSRLQAKLITQIPRDKLFPPISADVTRPSTLVPAFESASTVVSLVGILNGTKKHFEEIQARGAENVAKAAKEVGARVVHISAIGACTDGEKSKVAYWRTKGMGEGSVHNILGQDAVIVRPSLVFGPGDGFFAVSAVTPYFTQINSQRKSEALCETLEIPSVHARLWRWYDAFPACLCWRYRSFCRNRLSK